MQASSLLSGCATTNQSAWDAQEAMRLRTPRWRYHARDSSPRSPNLFVVGMIENGEASGVNLQEVAQKGVAHDVKVTELVILLYFISHEVLVHASH